MIKTSLIYFSIRGLNGALALASIYILTRILSAEQYGLYALGMAGIGLFASVLFQWIAVAVSRLYGEHALQPAKLNVEANHLFLCAAAILMTATVVFATWSPLPAVPAELTWAVGISAIAMGWHSLNLQVENARARPLRYGLLTTSRSLMVITSAAFLIQSGSGGVSALWAVPLACTLSSLIFGTLHQYASPSRDPQLRKQMVIYGLPLSMTYLATMVLDFSDRFMIGGLLGSSAVAGYAAAYDLTQLTVGAILNVFFLASYPRITTAWKTGGAAAAHKAMQPLGRALLIGAPLVTGVFIGLAPEISNMFFGEELRNDAAQVIPWVAVAIAVGCLKSYYLDIALQLAKVTHIQLIITVLMASLNIILNFILIPYYGMVGGAISTTVAFIAGSMFSWVYGRKINVYPITKYELLKMVLTLITFVSAMQFRSSILGIGLPEIAIRLACGLAAFVTVSLVTNLAGLRSILHDLLHKKYIGISR